MIAAIFLWFISFVNFWKSWLWLFLPVTDVITHIFGHWSYFLLYWCTFQRFFFPPVFFLGVSFWWVSIAMSSISLIFICQLYNVQLNPSSAFFISNITLFMSRSLMWIFVFLELPCLYLILSVFSSSISNIGNTVKTTILIYLCINSTICINSEWVLIGFCFGFFFFFLLFLLFLLLLFVCLEISNWMPDTVNQVLGCWIFLYIHKILEVFFFFSGIWLSGKWSVQVLILSFLKKKWVLFSLGLIFF